MMHDHVRRCTRKGVADPITKQKLFFEGCVDRWKKCEARKKQMFMNTHSKQEPQSWDARVREELGGHAEYHQPRQLRFETNSGRLNFEQSANVALLVKQHTRYHLAVKIVREREQEQRIAGSNPMQEAHPSSSSSSQSDGWWTS